MASHREPADAAYHCREIANISSPKAYHKAVIEYHSKNIIPKHKDFRLSVISSVITAAETIFTETRAQDRFFVLWLLFL
jgi:hypothetical protein